MSLPIFKKISLNGTMFNSEIKPETKYLCRLKPVYIGDGESHLIKRGWHTGYFNVFRDHCTFNYSEYVDEFLTEILEVYEIIEEE